MAAAIALIVVSRPALRRERTSNGAQSSGILPASGRNPLLDNLGIGHGGLKQLVAGSKGIKHHVGVWQQVLPVSRGQSDRVSEHLERIRLGQLCNGVKTAKRN